MDLATDIIRPIRWPSETMVVLSSRQHRERTRISGNGAGCIKRGNSLKSGEDVVTAVVMLRIRKAESDAWHGTQNVSRLLSFLSQ